MEETAEEVQRIDEKQDRVRICSARQSLAKQNEIWGGFDGEEDQEAGRKEADEEAAVAGE